MATYSTARHSQFASTSTPESAPSLAFCPSRAGIHPWEGPLTLSQMEHPPLEDPPRREQSRRVERGDGPALPIHRAHPHLHPSPPVIPRLREESRTCPITPFLALIRHSGRREPESIPGAGPLTLSQMEHPPWEDPPRREQSRRVERGDGPALPIHRAHPPPPPQPPPIPRPREGSKALACITQMPIRPSLSLSHQY